MKAKITDLNEEKAYDVERTLKPEERSFLIQPENKKDRARMPSIFSGQSPNQSSSTRLNKDASSPTHNLASIEAKSSFKPMLASNSNASFALE